MKVKTVEEMLMGPKHKVAEGCAIFDTVTEEFITDENEIQRSPSVRKDETINNKKTAQVCK